MYRGVIFIHAHDREAFDRVWRAGLAAIAVEPGRGQRWTTFAKATIETPAFCAREAERFNQDAMVELSHAADSLGSRNLVERIQVH